MENGKPTKIHQVLIALAVFGVIMVGVFIFGNEDAGVDINEQLAETVVTYENNQFGFTFEYPDAWGLVSETNTDFDNNTVQDGASGQFLTLDFANNNGEGIDTIGVSAASSTYTTSKGPQPISYQLNNGWARSGQNFIVAGGGEDSRLTSDNFVESAEVTSFNPDMLYVVEQDGPISNRTYSYVLNVDFGGVVIYTENADLLDQLAEVARTLQSN